MRLKDKSTSISSTNNEAREIIKTFNKAIKDILIELSNFSDEQINFNNQEKIKELLIRADDTINGCDTTKYFNCSKNPNFSILVYKYQRLTIKYEVWKLNSIIDKTNKKQDEIEEKQKKMEKQNNNIVYNILAFIASFSVVSASVTAFEKVSSVEDVLLFMAFTAFIIITTLIALDNFYRSNNEKKKILKNNYFLWGAVGVVIVLLLGYKSVNYIKENQNEIFENIGRGIESVRIEFENSNK